MSKAAIAALDASIEQLTATRDAMQKRHDETMAALAALDRAQANSEIANLLNGASELVERIFAKLMRR
ncbi:hypothetical protein [Sphingomonas xinjiangensis]|uniref:Uncharacterized protein n=1 Tax=Sphingomonas xinjiangensis TaxID=643568 RepID=A0A840YIV5_9SPHN|nr:hypothetical protein [Sphingomonas xinjiangensis]MBB5710838.1 hypothetical protein [Sphingomonas xinjiangensis]